VRLGHALVALQGHSNATQQQQQQTYRHEQQEVVECQQEPLDAGAMPCVEEARWSWCWNVLFSQCAGAHPCNRPNSAPPCALAALEDPCGATKACPQAGQGTDQHSSAEGAEGWGRQDAADALLSGCSWCLVQAHRLQLVLYGVPLLVPPAAPTPSHAADSAAGASGVQAPALLTGTRVGLNTHQSSSVDAVAHLGASRAALEALPACMTLLPPVVALQVLGGALALAQHTQQL
jgi:hypothetical protein